MRLTLSVDGNNPSNNTSVSVGGEMLLANEQQVTLVCHI